MYNKLIFKKFTNNNHLNEHLKLNRFIKMIEKEEIPIECVGFFNGETFNDVVAFYGSFYDSKVANIFSDTINDECIFSEKEISNARKLIQVEEFGILMH